MIKRYELPERFGVHIAVDSNQRVICAATNGFSHISLSGSIKDSDNVAKANFNIIPGSVG